MPASLIAPLLVIKAPKKMVFIVFGSIASFSQATSNISYQNINIFLKIAIRSYLAVAVFKHLSESLPEEGKSYMHDNFSWLPLAAAILVVTCTGCFIQRHKDR